MNLKKYGLNIDVSSINLNCKIFAPNSLFICLKENDLFSINEAIKNGAIAVMCKTDFNAEVPKLIVKDINKILSHLACEFYGHPSQSLNLIGVIGNSNSLVSLLSQTLNGGYIGLNHIKYNSTFLTNESQNLDIITINSALKDMVLEGKTFAIIEIPSTLYEEIQILKFSTIIYLGQTENPKEKGLIRDLFHTNDVIKIFNTDDPLGKILFSENKNSISFGIKYKADFQAININSATNTLCFDLLTKGRLYEKIETNANDQMAYFILAIIIVLLNNGFKIREIRKTLRYINQYNEEQRSIKAKAKIVIDFANTPNTLFNILKDTKKYCHGNLILILGTSGNKDQYRRSIMGVIASEMADFVLFTEGDNYTEDINDIISDLIKDIKKENYLIIKNRKEAIRYAYKISTFQDTILITGKGNEKTMQKDNLVINYSDYNEIIQYI